MEARRSVIVLGVLGLLAVLALQLVLSVSRQSPTWDEGNHLYAGYRSLTDGDFGLNPEHPPLVKMLAALPLIGLPLQVPELQGREFKHEAFLGGRDFLFGNDADGILLRARMTVALLALLLGLLVFAAAREMFGVGAAFVALALVACDPNLLAHGALVTTDVGVSCFLFATVYAFYRYAEAPSLPRLALVGLAVASSARAFPTYLAYSNELWGGPSQTHRYLTDSNVDWGQQLESLKSTSPAAATQIQWRRRDTSDRRASAPSTPGCWSCPCSACSRRPS